MPIGDKVGTLVVDLRTNTAKFNQGMDTATGKVKKFSAGISKAKTAVFALAGAGGLGLLVKTSLDTAFALDKTAQKLGITTEGLVGLRLAAEQSGVSANTLDMGLQRMTRRISEAAQGTGEAQAALKELGLDARQLAELQPDQAFLRIAQAMDQVSNEGDRVRLAFKLFDSEGVALKNTLDLGSQALIQARDDAVGFGKALSDVDSQQVAAAQVEFVRAKAAVSGLAQEIAVELAPVVERLARGTVNAVKAFKELLGIRSDEEQLNHLFQERAELIERLGQTRTGQARRQSAAIRERIEIITEEMNQIIARRDVTLAAYEEERDAFRELQQEKTKITSTEAAKRERVESQLQGTIQNLQLATFQHGANLLRALAPESKKAALAALVIEKGLAVASVMIQTEVAAARALAELGPIAGPSMAATIRGWGQASIGLIVATGLAQAGSFGSGPGLGGGATAGPTVSEQTPSESFFDPFSNTPTQSGSITINVNGVVTDEVMQDLVIPAIQDAVDNRDVIILDPNSRNGQEFAING